MLDDKNIDIYCFQVFKNYFKGSWFLLWLVKRYFRLKRIWVLLYIFFFICNKILLIIYVRKTNFFNPQPTADGVVISYNKRFKYVDKKEVDFPPAEIPDSLKKNNLEIKCGAVGLILTLKFKENESLCILY